MIDVLDKMVDNWTLVGASALSVSNSTPHTEGVSVLPEIFIGLFVAVGIIIRLAIVCMWAMYRRKRKREAEQRKRQHRRRHPSKARPRPTPIGS